MTDAEKILCQQIRVAHTAELEAERLYNMAKANTEELGRSLIKTIAKRFGLQEGLGVCRLETGLTGEVERLHLCPAEELTEDLGQGLLVDVVFACGPTLTFTAGAFWENFRERKPGEREMKPPSSQEMAELLSGLNIAALDVLAVDNYDQMSADFLCYKGKFVDELLAAMDKAEWRYTFDGENEARPGVHVITVHAVP